MALYAVVHQDVHLTVLWLPVVVLPFLVLVTGFSWMIASVTVYLRDVEQVMAILTMVLLFLAPIFYPLTAVPEAFRAWIMLNPLSFVVEQVRRVVIYGVPPDWDGLALYSLCAIAIAWLGYWLFQNLRRGFADVV